MLCCDISYYYLRYYVTQFISSDTANITCIIQLHYIPELTPIAKILD